MEFVIEVINEPALQPGGSDRFLRAGSMLSGNKALVTLTSQGCLSRKEKIHTKELPMPQSIT